MRRILALLSSDSVLTVVGLIVVAGSFWLLTDYQRSVTERALATHDLAEDLLFATLEQETGLRGFEASGDEEFLEEYARGKQEFLAARVELRERLHGDEELTSLLDAVVISVRAWQRAADDSILRLSDGTSAAETKAQLGERARAMDAAADTQIALSSRLEDEEESAFARSRSRMLAILLAVTSLYSLVALFVVRRRNAIDHDLRDARREFATALQAVDSEEEVSSLLVRRIARAAPEARTVVPLRRNASDDRLEPQSRVEDPAVIEALVDASPNSCLAVRLGQIHRQSPTEEPLLRCEICRATGLHTACVPSLVGGQVTGALLTAAPRRLARSVVDEIEGSVDQVAPVLAGLRTLALAELRARTDALTGLPNRRDAVATLHRMVAQAMRAATPLCAVMVDLDHFKRLNDEHGHEAGDAALAAVADAIQTRLRESDFASRWGGEEFLVLLPDTSRDGAVRLAEEMRETIAVTRSVGSRVEMTASFGVAELPSDAIDSDSLVREADRALYAAKQGGRNRVAVAASPGETLSPALA